MLDHANEDREESRQAAKAAKDRGNLGLSFLLAPSRLGGLSLWCSRIVTAD